MPVNLEISGSVQKLVDSANKGLQSLEGLSEGYKDLEKYSREAVSGAVKNTDKLAGSSSRVNKKFKEQKGIIENLEDHLARLAKGQKKAQDVKTIKKYNTEIAKTEKALKDIKSSGVKGFKSVNSSANASRKIFSNLRNTIATTFAPLFALTTAVEGVRQIISLVSEFQQSAADLSAITGAQGDALEYLKQQAVEVGIETTVSATQTLEAYKLIASAKPELLNNAEALSSITKEAIFLSEASGRDLPSSISNLADIMNQFSAPAEEASRYVNALAAGSKEGSAEVDDLAQSFLNSGSSMKSANVSFEEGVALIEALAERGKKGAEAGVGLRNVITKLSATEILPKQAILRLNQAGVDMDALSDKTLSFSDRLKALKPIQNDTNALVSVFGLENLTTAQVLLDQTNRINDLSSAVSGTSVAYKQAEVRTSTLRGEWARLKNTISALIQGDGDGISNLLTTIVKFTREGILTLSARLKNLQPTFNLVSQSVKELFDILNQFKSTSDEATDSTNRLSTAAKIINVPIRLFFVLLKAGVGIITDTISYISKLAGQNDKLKSFFVSNRKEGSSFLKIFLNLPGYVNGGIEAIRVFISEASSGLSQFGKNIADLFKEAFSFRKLVSEGTGDLKDAISNLNVNPFEGVGQKAKDAFEKGFEAANSNPVKIKIAPEVVDPGASSQQNTDSQGSENVTSINKIKKRQEDIEKIRLASLKNGAQKELKLESIRFNDLMSKLEKYGIDSSQAVEQHELNKFRIKQKYFDRIANLDQLEGEERINFLYNQAKSEISALEQALSEASGGSLAEDQIKQLTLLRKNASDQYLNDLESFYSEENTKAQEHEINLLELKRDSFSDQKSFEQFKEKEILNIRLKYAEKQLELISKLKGEDSDAALSLKKIINELKGSADEFSSVSNSGFSLYKLFGLDENDPESSAIINGLSTALSTAKDVYSQINKLRIQSAEEAINAADLEIESIDKLVQAKQTELDEQKSLAEDGFAYNEESLLKDIELLEQRRTAEEEERAKALEQKRKAQRDQARIDTITQGVSLITASANIFNSVSTIPFVGPVLGAALVAAMIGSFVAAKAKVFKSIKAEKGYHSIIKGKRHTQGGEKVSDRVEAEDGESLGILSRKSTRSFGEAHSDFIKAANSGDKKGIYRVAAKLAKLGRPDYSIADTIQEKNISVSLGENSDTEAYIHELKRSNDYLKQIIDNQKNAQTEQFSRGNRIIRKGNTVRVIKNG